MNGVTATDQLSLVFAALADPTRRAILAELAVGDATVTQLTAPLPISMPAVSRHLKVLEGAALISRSREGKWQRSHLEAAALWEAVPPPPVEHAPTRTAAAPARAASLRICIRFPPPQSTDGSTEPAWFGA